MAKVLITDDAAFMRMQLRDILTKLGHEVVGEAENWKVSVEQYQHLQPDLVTMDITMPEMNGIDAVKEIKKLYADPKIIMCSAMGKQGMVVDAIKAGARDFIIKPFSPERIKEAWEKVL
jgi:two-component system, chemotaxis family, chemotaxis protein CheY